MTLNAAQINEVTNPFSENKQEILFRRIPPHNRKFTTLSFFQNLNTSHSLPNLSPLNWILKGLLEYFQKSVEISPAIVQLSYGQESTIPPGRCNEICERKNMEKILPAPAPLGVCSSGLIWLLPATIFFCHWVSLHMCTSKQTCILGILSRAAFTMSCPQVLPFFPLCFIPMLEANSYRKILICHSFYLAPRKCGSTLCNHYSAIYFTVYHHSLQPFFYSVMELSYFALKIP